VHRQKVEIMGKLERGFWGCIDSDWDGCLDTCESTSGYLLMFQGCVISLKTIRTFGLALSTQAEFMAASSLVHQVLAVRKLIDKVISSHAGPTLIGGYYGTSITWCKGFVRGFRMMLI